MLGSPLLITIYCILLPCTSIFLDKVINVRQSIIKGSAPIESRSQMNDKITNGSSSLNSI
jgi:hypothetical protein